MSNATITNVMDIFNPVKNSKQTVCEESALYSTSKVDDLVMSIQRKSAEASALAKEIAQQKAELISICGHVDDGSSKFNTEHFLITTSTTATRKITDLKAIQGLAPTVLREKFELDTRKFKKLATDNPVLYQKVVGCIETTISKPSVKIEAVGG
jgi:hypothetical protein